MIDVTPSVSDRLARSRTIPDQEGTEMEFQRVRTRRPVDAAERSPIRRGLK